MQAGKVDIKTATLLCCDFEKHIARVLFFLFCGVSFFL